MCYFSAEGVPNRQARVGDQLVTAQIGSHGTIGLVEPSKPQTAVCLLQGTKLVVSGIPRSRRRRWNVPHEAAAIFAQLSEEDGYRDGVTFGDNGMDRHVLFQDFPVRIHVTVEAIPGVDAKAPARELLAPPVRESRGVREVVTAGLAAIVALFGGSPWT